MRPFQPALLLLLLIGPLLSAQSGLDARIVVDREGLYEVTWLELSRLTDGRPLDTENLILSHNGVEVPISFRAVTGTRFDRPSALQFYAKAHVSPYSKRGVYRLRSRPGTARIRERALGQTSRDVGEAKIRQHFEEDLIFDPMETLQTSWLDLKPEDRRLWLWARIRPVGEDASKSILLRMEPPPRPIDKSLATIRLNFRGNLAPNTEQTIEVDLAGQRLGERSWTTGTTVSVEFTVPVEDLKSDNILTLRNVSKEQIWTDPGNQVRAKRSNDILLDSIDVEFRNLLVAPTKREPQLIYNLETVRNQGRVRLQFTNPGIDTFRLYDVASRSWLRGAEVDVAADSQLKIIACSSDGFMKAIDVRPWTQRNLKHETKGAEWVVISLERFAEFTDPLRQWREEQGLSTMLVSDREIYDSFNGGAFSPEAITEFLSHGLENWEVKPRYVLLVGDADFNVDWVSERDTLPTGMVPTYYNGMTASDRALMPNDEIAVGRFPARRADEVIRMVARTVEYEKSAEQGAWRRRLNFIASEGRFGALVDTMIERYAATVLTETIPASYDVTMTYASPSSPYLYPPKEFNAQVIRRFNEGALVFAYMGHGYAQGFDQLRVGDQRYPIFSRDDLIDVDSGARAPLAVIIACSTAEFDQPTEDAVAEGLMRRSGGPLALIGGTRITHPLPNSLLSKELLGRLFAAETPTIGEALRASQDALVGNWKSDPVAMLARPLVGSLDINRLMDDHRHLYVLLGDPASRLAMPTMNIDLTAAAEVESPGQLLVSGVVKNPAVNTIQLRLEVRRDRMVTRPERVSAGDPQTSNLIKSNYEAANRKILLQVEVPVVDGKFSTTLDLPMGLPKGPAVLKACHDGHDSMSMGSLDLVIATDEGDETEVKPEVPNEN